MVWYGMDILYSTAPSSLYGHFISSYILPPTCHMAIQSTVVHESGTSVKINQKHMGKHVVETSLLQSPLVDVSSLVQSANAACPIHVSFKINDGRSREVVVNSHVFSIR